MADLSDLQSAQTVKLAGASAASGLESNYVEADVDGRLKTRAVVRGGSKGITSEADVTSENISPDKQSLHVTLLSPPGSSNQVEIQGKQESKFDPDHSSYLTNVLDTLRTDIDSNLRVRGRVHVDECSFREDFNGASLVTNLTGVATFVNGSTVVTGVGTLFLTEVKKHQYVRLDADGTTFYAQVKSMDSNTQITLYIAYLGAGGSGAASVSSWRYSSSGVGAGITVANSNCTIACGTANGATNFLARLTDYLPLMGYMDFSVSQRIANQSIILGFVDNPAAPAKRAYILFDGTNAGQIKFVTASSAAAADTQTTVVVLPGGKNTSQQLDYEINLTATSASLVIEGQVRAVHTDSIPGPYDVMELVCLTSNTAAVTNTNVILHVALILSVNQLQITNSFKGEPLKVQLVGAPGTTVSGFSDGKYRNSAALANTIQVAPTSSTVRDGQNSPSAFPYREQTVDAQRSILSSSANDAAAGTGARTVRITYYDSTGTGPFYETVTLNGVAAVNTVATNICFIEKMTVETAGATGYAAGNIQLKAAAGGGGVTIGAILLGATRTYWCHHYVTSGYTLYITSATCATTGTVAGAGGIFWLTARPLVGANVSTQTVSDTLRVPGSVSSIYRGYDTPIQVVGPALVVGNVSNTSAAAYECYMSFSYYEA